MLKNDYPVNSYASAIVGRASKSISTGCWHPNAAGGMSDKMIATPARKGAVVSEISISAGAEVDCTVIGRVRRGGTRAV